MKKTTFILLAVMALISSCSKQGPIGPQGPQGDSGPPSSAYELQFNVQADGWTESGTSGTAGAHIYANLVSPYLSYDSVGTGAVIVYYQINYTNGGYGNEALPYINYNTSGTQFNNQYGWTDQVVSIVVYNSLYSFTTWTSSVTYNVVVIPGYRTLPASVNKQDYNSVIAYYHPRVIKR